IMWMRHASAGLPLIRTNTGSGLRQRGLMALALRALTRMKGLIPRIFMVAVKPEAFIEISTRTRTTDGQPLRMYAKADSSCWRTIPCCHLDALSIALNVILGVLFQSLAAFLLRAHGYPHRPAKRYRMIERRILPWQRWIGHKA